MDWVYLRFLFLFASGYLHETSIQLLQQGVTSLEDLATCPNELLTAIPGIGEAGAEAIRSRALELVEEKRLQEEEQARLEAELQAEEAAAAAAQAEAAAAAAAEAKSEAEATADADAPADAEEPGSS